MKVASWANRNELGTHRDLRMRQSKCTKTSGWGYQCDAQCYMHKAVFL